MNRTRLFTRGDRPRGARRTRACLAVALTVSATTSVSLAGLVGGGDTHDWTGSVSASWQTAANWNINQVPAAGDSVIVLGGSNNVLLFGDSADLASLYIGGARAVSNNGHVLTVTNGAGTTTVAGMDSSLFVVPEGGGGFGVVTDVLSIESGGDLDMAGGEVLVHEQLDISGGGRIVGHGYVDVDAPNAAALNGAGGDAIIVSGGDLHLRVFGGGSMALPGQITMNEADHDLVLTGDLFTPIGDVDMAGDTALIVGESWTLGGALTASTGGAGEARITGDGAMTVVGDLDVASGSCLRIETTAGFESTSTATVATNGTLELADWYDTAAGHVTSLGMGGRLLVQANHFAAGWQGAIDSSAGIIEVNTALGMSVHGDLHLGSVFGLRSTIAGSGDVRAFGAVNAPGLGADVDGRLDLRSGAVMTLGPSAQIIVNGELDLRNGSDTVGDGQLTVNEGGALVVEDGASVHADIVNGGTMRAGFFNQVHYAYLDGAYTQDATGTLRVEIGGPSNTDRDIYETSGPATLAGELVVNLVNGYTPAIGESFEIMWANEGRSGAFGTLAGTPGFEASYTPTTAIVTYVGEQLCPEDINNDGMIDVTDLVAVILAWNTADPDADIDGSGTVDVGDLVAVILAWGGCGM